MNQDVMGVSVIICCYNSAERIAATLRALALQENTSAFPWEIVLVDNNSNDNTVALAQEVWHEVSRPVILRIVVEKEPGLANARRKGISCADFSIVIFCDDDNWLFPDYVERSFQIMKQHATIAAVGGCGFPVFETVFSPSWFPDYQEAYAVGPQDIGNENGLIFSLYGAGLVVRKDALEFIHRCGFQAYFTGRKGKLLCSTEDTELTNVLCICGYDLMYDEGLKFHHFLKKERLTKNYLERLFKAFGYDGPVRNLYHSHLTRRITHRYMRNWIYHMMIAVSRLVKYLILPPKKGGRKIYMLWSLAYLGSLLSLFRKYGSLDHQMITLRRNAIALREREANMAARPKAIASIVS